MLDKIGSHKIRTYLAATTLMMGLAAGVAGTAGASPATMLIVTHTMNHPDTTSVAGACTVYSANGPVWAYDNLSLRYDITSTGSDTYSVVIYASGTFSGFSDPLTGVCSTSHGSVKGWLSWDVTSTTPPSAAYVPAQEVGSLGQTGDILVGQIFNGGVTNISGGSYSYSYTLIDGGVYTQYGS